MTMRRKAGEEGYIPRVWRKREIKILRVTSTRDQGIKGYALQLRSLLPCTRTEYKAPGNDLDLPLHNRDMVGTPH